MSLIIGNGICLTYGETNIKCPICTAVFDASAKMARAKYPILNTRCPHCKGKITISEPMYSGELKCWETECPHNVARKTTITKNKVNGRVVSPKLYDDNSDEPDELLTPNTH